MLFNGFKLGEDVPDETTLYRFRNKLIERGLDKKLFEEINRQIEMQDFQIHATQGAIVDATIIESAARPKRTIHLSSDREQKEEEFHQEELYEVKESADPDARWLKKGKRFLLWL